VSYLHFLQAQLTADMMKKVLIEIMTSAPAGGILRTPAAPKIPVTKMVIIPNDTIVAVEIAQTGI
jgi:hypothetical protein